MRYVCIDDGAVAELISGRQYQSIDFEEGDKLIQALSGRLKFFAHIGSITLFQDKEGAFLTTTGPWKKKKYLVIDCEQSSLFTQLRANESLISFQKLLRFCTKYWSNGIFTNSEKLISGTSKAVIFPMPFSSGTAFRIALEREPSQARLMKRDMDGHFLLVYKSGREKADSSKEIADETVFKSVFDRLQSVYAEVNSATQNRPTDFYNDQVNSTDIVGDFKSSRSILMPYKDWLPVLTNRQRKFVFAPTATPHRLQGPAGTGKTLSLILRTLRALQDADRKKIICNALIITHSEATSASIKNSLSVIDPNGYQNKNRSEKASLEVHTLASLCANHLQQAIKETEFLDRDAQDSKILQQLYIEQAIKQAIEKDLPSFKPYLSAQFERFLHSTDQPSLSRLFQHEISVQIKGRAGQSFDKYAKCPNLNHGLPILNEADKGFSFSVYEKYQEQLEATNQFDTDDVVISAVGQLDTPIWRRRRAREGYDFIAIDETHLFNINELHVFHYFTRDPAKCCISFTVDQAQAVGDRGWNDTESLNGLFGDEESGHEARTEINAVFRSSPQIRDFCHSILASGATLFTSFSNTLQNSQSAFTNEEERKSQPIKYFVAHNDIELVSEAFKQADAIQQATSSTKPQVLITTLSDDILKRMENYAHDSNKPITLINKRGDFTSVKHAEKSGHFVLSHADFVGGLEFNAVVIVGVDKGRVPFEGELEDANSRSFATYSAHNRLYVAASRAKYGLSLLGVKSRGPSDLLKAAITSELVQLIQS